MAKFTDSTGAEWSVRLSVPVLLRICRKLNLTLASITRLEIGLADAIESIPLAVEEQLKERKLTGPELLERLDGPALAGALKACQDAVVEAFPQAARATGGAAKGATPFESGAPTTS